MHEQTVKVSTTFHVRRVNAFLPLKPLKQGENVCKNNAYARVEAQSR